MVWIRLFIIVTIFVVFQSSKTISDFEKSRGPTEHLQCDLNRFIEWNVDNNGLNVNINNINISSFLFIAIVIL